MTVTKSPNRFVSSVNSCSCRFNDVSTTAAAVTASSAEAFAALCLPPDDHDELMCFTSPSPGQAETPFYKRYAHLSIDCFVMRCSDALSGFLFSPSGNFYF